MIVITGTVSPAGKVEYLKIRNAEERLEQYRNALESLVSNNLNENIVFCDNSNYDVSKFDYLRDTALAHGNNFEALSFLGNTEAVARQGKGYGEGEIMEYILSNSSFASKDQYIVKITGRLIIDNIEKIMGTISKDRIYFNVPNFHRRDMLDTRFYGMPADIFKEYFIHAYKNVDDANNRTLEYVYTDVIRDNSLVSRNFPRYPRILGVSGTSGVEYVYTEWKSKIKDWLSIFNVYGKLCKGENV